MQKANDKVDWQAVIHILKLMGFDDKIGPLIFRCLSSVLAKLPLNGSSFGRIPMNLGIRQKDPISSFLFAVLFELFSTMLFQLETNRKIHGVNISRLTPSITNIFFVDDLLIFCRANTEGVGKVVKCLRQYCSWTGI